MENKKGLVKKITGFPFAVFVSGAFLYGCAQAEVYQSNPDVREKTATPFLYSRFKCAPWEVSQEALNRGEGAMVCWLEE